jgi:hypothetical protein
MTDGLKYPSLLDKQSYDKMNLTAIIDFDGWFS